MAEKTLMQIIAGHDLHKPTECPTCKSDQIEYLGLGQYRCKECLTIMYDDYGKTRKYIEEHPGATEVDVHTATGVSRDTIRQFVREDRFYVVNERSRNLDE